MGEKKKQSSIGWLVFLLILVIAISVVTIIYFNNKYKNYQLPYCTTCPEGSTCQSLTDEYKRCNYCHRISSGVNFYAKNPCEYGKKDQQGYIVPAAYGLKNAKTQNTRKAAKEVKKYNILYPGQNKKHNWACVPTSAKCKNCKNLHNIKWEPNNLYNEKYYDVCKNCIGGQYTTCTEKGKKCGDHN